MRKIIANDGKSYYLPKKPLWKKGYPKNIGWYPASFGYDIESIIFFNGEFWSGSCFPDFDSETAGNIATIKSKNTLGAQYMIEWSLPWWTSKAQAKIKKSKP